MAVEGGWLQYLWPICMVCYETRCYPPPHGSGGHFKPLCPGSSVGTENDNAQCVSHFLKASHVNSGSTHQKESVAPQLCHDHE